MSETSIFEQSNGIFPGWLSVTCRTWKEVVGGVARDVPGWQLLERSGSEMTAILKNVCSPRRLHKENRKRCRWLQNLMASSDRSHSLYRYASSGGLRAFPGIETGPTWDVREKVPTWVCWTPPFPGVYRCCPLPNDGQVLGEQRYRAGRITCVLGFVCGHTGSLPLGSSAAASWSCVRWLCWLIWNGILWCFPYLSRNFEALWGGNPFNFFSVKKIW